MTKRILTNEEWKEVEDTSSIIREASYSLAEDLKARIIQKFKDFPPPRYFSLKEIEEIINAL